ncbi:MAG: hypothetical protein M3P18_10090 [Actinomycetota bacterium]|nr:hypothetical protein [Actinomycetota bacterium]
MLEDEAPRAKDAAVAAGEREARDPDTNRDNEERHGSSEAPEVDEQSSDSFPASDPPVW